MIDRSAGRACQPAELFYQFESDRPRVAIADRSTVQLNSRDHFCSGTGKKTFVCDQYIVPCQIRFLNRNAVLLGEFKDDASGNPSQDPGIDGRGRDHSFLDHEQIVPGTLGYIALFVQHNSFSRTRLLGLDLSQDVVQIVQGLNPWAQCGRRDPSNRASRQGQALFIQRVRIKGDGGGDDDDTRPATTVRAKPERTNASGYQQPDVTIVQVVLPDSVKGRFHQFGLR